MNVLSLLRPATPRGAVGSYFRSSFTPAIASTLVASMLIVTNSLEPQTYECSDQLVTVRDHVNALHAIRNVHEAAGLSTV